jgi:hypothetical protein
MKIRNTAAMVAAIAIVASIQTTQAAPLTGVLNGGNSITIGDKTFSGFTYTASDDQASALADQALGLTISAFIGNGVNGVLGVYYLDFKGAIAINNLGGTSPLLGDLALSYTVTVNSGSTIDYIDQQYTPNGLPVPGNQIIIGETAIGATASANSTLTLNPTDISDPAPEVGDNLNFSTGQTSVAVVKDILIAAATNQLVGLSDVRQSFHQVPEPTTVIAGALLLLPFGVSTLRIMRKNRTP